MSLVNVRALIYATDRYCAVVLALFVAFSLDLRNPWWAMATVFMVQPASPYSGAIWAKATYRVAGTVIGLIVALAIVPSLADSPELMILAIALWIGLCIYLGLLDRSPRSYLFMLSGYTVALIGLPSAVDPGGLFDTCVARAEEITIGVLASAVVQSLLMPPSGAKAMIARIDGVIAVYRTGADDVLRRVARTSIAVETKRLATELTEINLMATDLRYEVAFRDRDCQILRALQERLIALLPLVNGIEDRLNAFFASYGAMPEFTATLEELAAWIKPVAGVEPKPLSEICERISRLAPPLDATSCWSDLLLTSLTTRLVELATSWYECRRLRAALDGQRLSAEEHKRLLGRTLVRLLHTDHQLALFSAAVAVFTILCGAVFTVATAWESGSLAIGIAAVSCSLFAAADNPSVMVEKFAMGFCCAFPIALLYEFALLPSIDGFVMLAVSLLPVIFVGSLALAQRKIFLPALATQVGFSSGLALQPSFVSDLPSFLNAYVALLAGAFLAMTTLRLLRSFPTDFLVRRILRTTWRDVARLAYMRVVPERTAWISRMLDRAGLLLPRMAQAGPQTESQLIETLADLRLGVSMIELRTLPATIGATAKAEIDRTLRQVAGHFTALASDRQDELGASSLTQLDSTIARILELPGATERSIGITAAVALRRTLFPEAPAYQPLAQGSS